MLSHKALQFYLEEHILNIDFCNATTFNLESSVERPRFSASRGGWQGAATRAAVSCKDAHWAHPNGQRDRMHQSQCSQGIFEVMK